MQKVNNGSVLLVSMDENFCGAAAVAKYLGVTRATVINWCNSGAVDGAILMGGKWRIPRDRVIKIKKEGLVLPKREK